MNVNEILAEMSETERNLTLAIDDAMDALMLYKLGERYPNVTFECNPNGDRNLIRVNDKDMNHEEFAEWLASAEAERILDKLFDEEPKPRKAAVVEELPSEVNIQAKSLMKYEDKPSLMAKVKAYLKDKFGHYLSGLDEAPTIVSQGAIIRVSNIHWGRRV